MKQALLKFSLPLGAQLYANQFKDLVCKACDGKATVPSAFFHYENGAPIPNAEPDIRFVGGKSWVGILSLSGDVDMLLPVAGLASMALSKHVSQPVSMQLIEANYDIETTHTPYKYYFRDVVSKKAKNWKGTNEDLVISILIRRLQAERDRLGLDFPGIPRGDLRNHEYLQADLEYLKERLAINVHDIRDLGMRVVTANGTTNMFARLLSGSFTMYAKATGIWQIGNLQSRGHGRLILDIGA